MSSPICLVCGDLLNPRVDERGVCTLCQHRTSPQERAAITRLLAGVHDAA